MAEFSTFLLFNGRAEEAMNFYVSLFADSRVLHVTRKGTRVERAELFIAGRPFVCSDSSEEPEFGTSPAVSIYVECASGVEIAELFARLSEDGRTLMPLGDYSFARKFGWVTDRFGISWQLVLRVPSGDVPNLK